MTLGDGEVEGELRVSNVKDLEVSHTGMSLMSRAGYIPETSLLKREGFTATISSVEERTLSLLMMASIILVSGASNSSHDL